MPAIFSSQAVSERPTALRTGLTTGVPLVKSGRTALQKVAAPVLAFRPRETVQRGRNVQRARERRAVKQLGDHCTEIRCGLVFLRLARNAQLGASCLWQIVY